MAGIVNAAAGVIGLCTAIVELIIVAVPEFPMPPAYS